MTEKKAGKTVTEAQALSILGERRFLSAGRVAAAWNKMIKERRTEHAIPPIEPAAGLAIRYGEKTLKEVAEDTGWYLIYDPEFSLRDTQAILGTDTERQPCFRGDNDWWFAEREDYWAGVSAEPAYYLVRMEGLFSLDNPARDWDWQDEQIKQMGEAFERTPTRIVVNACISCFLLNNQRFLEATYNFGPEMDADYCFLVTNFEPRGLNLGHWLRNDWGGYWVSGLTTSVARKFDA